MKRRKRKSSKFFLLIVSIFFISIGLIYLKRSISISIFTAESKISDQQRRDTVDIVWARMDDRQMDGIVFGIGNKVILVFKKNDLNKIEDKWLFRKGHLCLLDESRTILFDNEKNDFVESAEAQMNENIIDRKSYKVIVRFKEKFADGLSKATQENIGKTFMLVLDNEIYADPLIKEEVDDGKFIMDSIETRESAQILEDIWNSKCLPCEFIK